MRRRDFVTLLGSAAATWPIAARAKHNKLVRPFLPLRAQREADEFCGDVEPRRGCGRSGKLLFGLLRRALAGMRLSVAPPRPGPYPPPYQSGGHCGGDRNVRLRAVVARTNWRRTKTAQGDIDRLNPTSDYRVKLSQRSPVLGRRHAGGAPERAGEARLRGKLAMESNLVERRASRRDHRLGALQPPSADVAMRRHAHGGGKCAGEMKHAETRDMGKVGARDVFSEMLFDVGENTPQPSIIQSMSRLYRGS